ncbi:MAG: anti-sigma factor antagonist [Chloroflexi bacterium]|nr:anti-sigma factor antagonist [Chloroflexota bacterium]
MGEIIMEITVSQASGRVSVTIIALSGALDGSNYEELIATGRAAHAAGAKAILLDIAGLTFMSSAGLVALHNLYAILKDEVEPDPEAGWATLKTVGNAGQTGSQPFVKLLNPQPAVMRTLEITGMHNFFEVHTDRETALQSF